MAGSEIDSLFRSKTAGARRGRVGLIIAVCAAVVGVVCAVAFGLSQSRSAAGDRTQPAPVETQVPAAVAATALPETTPPPPVASQPPAPVYAHELRLVWLGETEPEESVQVEVLREETVTETLEIGPDNDWTARWEDQYPSEELTLAGSLPPGSDVTYSLNGNSFVLTARLGQVVNVESDGAYLPKTGLRWTAVVLLSLLACGCFASYIMMKKSQA